MTPNSHKKVLFVCLGNSCRSPMAEAIARHIASDVMHVSSAGLSALGEIQSETKRTLKKNGYPAKGLSSKSVTDDDLEQADFIINLTGRPAVVTFSDCSKVEDWPVEDPYGTDPETYQRIFEEIERRVVNLVARIRHSAPTYFGPGYVRARRTRIR